MPPVAITDNKSTAENFSGAYLFVATGSVSRVLSKQSSI